MPLPSALTKMVPFKRYWHLQDNLVHRGKGMRRCKGMRICTIMNKGKSISNEPNLLSPGVSLRGL